MNERLKPIKSTTKVCDDKPLLNAAKSEWVYDDENKMYHRMEGGKRLRSIRGDSLPDVDKLFIQRKQTAALMVKHISPDKMQEITDFAVKKGKNPEKAILDAFEIRTAPSAATQAICAHWKAVKNAN